MSQTPAPPAHAVSVAPVRVSVVDTDMMGIVHHANYVVYFEKGRLEYLRRRGMPYKALVERGLHLPVVELQLRYRKAARYDDLLQVETRVGALSRVTVRFDYRILRSDGASTAGAELLVEGHVLLACVDDRHKPRPLPEDAVRALLSAEPPGSPAHSW